MLPTQTLRPQGNSVHPYATIQWLTIVLMKPTLTLHRVRPIAPETLCHQPHTDWVIISPNHTAPPQPEGHIDTATTPTRTLPSSQHELFLPILVDGRKPFLFTNQLANIQRHGALGFPVVDRKWFDKMSTLRRHSKLSLPKP